PLSVINDYPTRGLLSCHQHNHFCSLPVPVDRRLHALLPVFSLVFPELLEKTALVDFLKQREINTTLRRCLLCLRQPFSHVVENKLYAVESRVRNFLESL